MWGVSCPFASDTSPTWIDRGGLGKRLTGTRRLGKCKILIWNQLVKSKVKWSFFSYNNPRQEHNVYSKLFNFGESLLPVIWYNVHCSLRWFFTLNNVTAYFCYWAQQVNLQEEGVTADVVSCNKLFSWWIDVVAVTWKVTRERHTKGSESEEGG